MKTILLLIYLLVMCGLSLLTYITQDYAWCYIMAWCTLPYVAWYTAKVIEEFMYYNDTKNTQQ